MTSTGTVHSPTTIQARAGIDCAIVANHQCELIEYRDDGTTRTTRKTIPSTAAGMNELTRFLAAVDVAVDVVAEPTSLTWVGIQAAVGAAGGRFYLIGTRHSSRLRAAVAGKNKSDVIDAHLLAKALDLFDLEPLVVADVGSEAIKRSALSGAMPACTTTSAGADCVLTSPPPFRTSTRFSPDLVPARWRCWGGGLTCEPWPEHTGPRSPRCCANTPTVVADKSRSLTNCAVPRQPG